MARFARVIVPGYPYHITHRGNRREDVFFKAADRDVYRAWLRRYADEFGLEIWAYCLMSNHVHLIAVPRRADSLARAIGRTHMRYARRTNRLREWSGHLWANRFFSTPLDESHLWQAVKYVELNPVRAGMAARAEDYAWSSARAHALGEPDGLLSQGRPFPAPGLVGDWSAWLATGLSEESVKGLRYATATGRPCGGEPFVSMFEGLLGRLLRPLKRGRKKKEEYATNE